ncbi:MAG TPA: hypothetical protein VHT03_02615 [Rhizomicrobium sp.]|nr:hypothetical protein [Rhizomicrobium sp.]
MTVRLSNVRFSLAAAVAAALFGMPVASLAQPGGNGGAWHIFATPSYEARTGRVPDLGTSGRMEYFGGRVFSTVEAVSVMWGPNVNATTVKEIPDFTAALVNSTFLDQLREYSTKGVQSVNGHKSSDQKIHRGTYFGQVQITPQNQNTTLTDKDIQKELAYQISIGALPPLGKNIVYMVYFPTNITINLGGLLSCQDFGAYHSASTARRPRANTIYYAVEPDCSSGFSFITFAASHEFAEATTDNIPTPGSNPAYPQAWNTSDGYEIGDLCSGSGTLTDATRSYTVTQVYLNSTAACSTGNYTSP